MVKAYYLDNWFASLDGEDFLPVSREPEPGDEEVVRELFDDKPSADKDTARAMRWHRSFLEVRGATFAEV